MRQTDRMIEMEKKQNNSLFIMGEEKAADFWREHKDDFDAILMSDDGTLYVTEGLENDFSTERTVEIIR